MAPDGASLTEKLFDVSRMYNLMTPVRKLYTQLLLNNYCRGARRDVRDCVARLGIFEMLLHRVERAEYQKREDDEDGDYRPRARARRGSEKIILLI